MPLKSNKKNADSNGVQKKNSRLKTIFKKHNQDKITLRGIKDFFIDIFYRVGCDVEYTYAHIGKILLKAFNVINRFTLNILKDIALFVDKLGDTLLDDLGEPFDRIEQAFSNVADIMHQVKDDKNRKAGKEVREYLSQGFKKHKNLSATLYSYVIPFLTMAVFFIVVTATLNREYAIEVILGNENIGTISSYTVLENADKIIKNKLVSTENQQWNLDSSIKMVSLGSKQTMDERQLADSILSASSEDIVEATGLYVDGKFYGAVKDPTALKAALATLTQPYENGSENRTVSFVQSVSVTSGIFFSDSVVPDSELAKMVVSEVSGEKHYTVVKGDSPSLIAQKNGITLSQFYSLNPEMPGLWIGDVVLVGASVPFLQVKYIERVVREVEIPFTYKTEKNNSLSLGTSKVSQSGEKGLKEETVDVEYIDGIYQNETVVQTNVLKEPVTQITQQGTLWNGQVIEGGTGKIMWPTAAGRISRGFAGQYPAYHNGLDIAAPYGTAIFAADSGVVVKSMYTNSGYGIYLIIEHGGYQTLYGHCSSLLVSAGDRVTKGQLIARVGSTGNSTGNHLHFEVKNGNWRYDPMTWF